MPRTCWTNAANAEHIFGTCLQCADHIQCILRATRLIGVKARRKEKKKRKEEKKKAVPRAAAAYGRQLKIILLRSAFAAI